MSAELTVVLPTLNEAGCLRAILPRLRDTFAKLGVKGDILVVDGPSIDGTADVAAAAGARVLKQSGRGLGNALREGLLAAESPWIAVVDADGSHPPEVLEKMWAAKANADLVIASRNVAGGSAVMDLSRRFLSGLLNFCCRVMLGFPVKDSSGGFRLYAAKFAKDASRAVDVNDFTIQQELLAAILKNGGRVVEIPFRYEHRIDGASKASALRLAPAYLRLLFRRRA